MTHLKKIEDALGTTSIFRFSTYGYNLNLGNGHYLPGGGGGGGGGGWEMFLWCDSIRKSPPGDLAILKLTPTQILQYLFWPPLQMDK